MKVRSGEGEGEEIVIIRYQKKSVAEGGKV